MKQRYCDGSRQTPWNVTVRPGCGEMSAVLKTPPSPREHVKPGESSDPERSARESVRRASAMVRRLSCEFGLNRLVTLTFAPEHQVADRHALVSVVRSFQERLRKELPDLPYLIVSELHPGGHGYHLHMAIGRYVPKERIADLWGLGFVDVRRIKVKGHSGAREASRRAAHYVAKYIDKAMDEVPPGSHRYWRPQGLVIEEIRAECESADMQAVLALYVRKDRIQWFWTSAGEDDWRGPPCLAWRW